MQDWTDQPQEIRKGEALDVGRLEPYLQSQLNISAPLNIEQFPSGFSNLTYFLKMGDQEMVLRRPPFGANIKGGHDMSREYRVLSKLNPVYDKAPKPLLFCDDPDILGADFYVMERVRGVILRANMPTAMYPDVELMSNIADSLVGAFAELHSIDVHAAGLADFGKSEGYVQRQIEGWNRRYQKAQTDEIASIDAIAKWLSEHMPAQSATTLVHNDYRYDNMILDSNDWSKIIAVLDWEMSTLGDPLMDLGSSLSYWIQADDPDIMKHLSLSPTYLPGNPTRLEFVRQYEEKSGREVKEAVFYFVYGLHKLAVILQQIYARYKLGHTKDERFAGLIHAVDALGQMAEQAIEKDSL